MKAQKYDPNESAGDRGLSAMLAYILDDFLKIPGTKRRIGLDPIIGMIPGIGDLLSSGAGLAVLAMAARRKMPMLLYIKMISNWALNAIIGAIPVLGDAFSFWFKSNRRNHEMLQQHLNAGGPKGTGGGWGALIVLAVMALLVIFLMFAIAGFVWNQLFGS